MDRYGRSVSAYPILQGGDFPHEQAESFHRVKEWLLNQDEYVAFPPPLDEPSVHPYYYKREEPYASANSYYYKREDPYIDDYLPSRYCSDSQLNHYITNSITDTSNFRKLESRRYHSPNLTRRRPNGSRESNINKIYASTPDALDKLTDSNEKLDNTENYADKINTFPRRHKTEKQHPPIPTSLLQQQSNMGQQLEKYQPFSCSENVLQNTHGAVSPEKKIKGESKYKVRLLRPKSWSEMKTNVFNYSQIEGNYYKHKDLNDNENANTAQEILTTSSSRALNKREQIDYKKRHSNEPLHIRMRSAPETHGQPTKAAFQDEYRRRVPSLIRKVKAFSWPKRAIIQSYSTVSLAKDADHPQNKTESGYNTEKSEEKQSDEKDIEKPESSDRSSELSDTPPARPPFPQPQSLKKTLSNRKSSGNVTNTQSDTTKAIMSKEENSIVDYSPINADVIKNPTNSDEAVYQEMSFLKDCTSNSPENISMSTTSSGFENVELKDECSTPSESCVILGQDNLNNHAQNDETSVSQPIEITTDNQDFDSTEGKSHLRNAEAKCRVSINLQVRNTLSDSQNFKSSLENIEDLPIDEVYDVIETSDSKELLDENIDSEGLWEIEEVNKEIEQLKNESVEDNLDSPVVIRADETGFHDDPINKESKILHCKSASEDASLSLIQEKDCSDLSRSASISLRDLIRIHEQEIARVAGRPNIDYSSTDIKRKSCIIETKPKIESPSHWKRHTTIGLVSERRISETVVTNQQEENHLDFNELDYPLNDGHARINSSLSSTEFEIRSPKSFSSVNWPKSPVATHAVQVREKPTSLSFSQSDINENVFSPKSTSSQKIISSKDVNVQTDYIEHIDEDTLLRREESYRQEIDFYHEQVLLLTAENDRIKHEFESEREEMHRKLDEQRKVANAYQKLEDRYRRKVYELQKRLHKCTCSKSHGRNTGLSEDGWSSRTLSPYCESAGRRDHEISVEKVNGILHQLEAWLNNQNNAAMITDTSEVSSVLDSACDDHNYARYRLVDHYASAPLEIIEQIDATPV